MPLVGRKEYNLLVQRVLGLFQRSMRWCSHNSMVYHHAHCTSHGRGCGKKAAPQCHPLDPYVLLPHSSLASPLLRPSRREACSSPG